MVSYTFFLKSGRTIECDSYATADNKVFTLYGVETGGRELEWLEIQKKDVECHGMTVTDWEGEDVPF